MMELIADLSKLRLGVVTPDMEKCAAILKEELPFETVRTPSGTEYNGWIVPDSWHVEKATIHNDKDALIQDGEDHLIGVYMYSPSFVAGIGGAYLKQHLSYSGLNDNARIFHCDNLYKPHKRDWGFSVTKKFYDSIGDREAFHVELRTVTAPGEMLSHTASSIGSDPNPASFLMMSHNCHPSLCNDDLSGIAVGIEVMKRLPQGHRHTYRIIVMPEHYGTIFPLSDPSCNWRQASGGVFLEAFGTTGPLALQRSFTGVALIDRAIRNAVSGGNNTVRIDESGSHQSGPYGAWYEKAFRQVAGNDETTMEAPGIEVPFASLTRYPFPQYHTSDDTVELMDAGKLEEAVQVMLDAIDILERDCVMTRTCPDGLVCLSNPKYDLYLPFWDPSMKDRANLDQLGAAGVQWNYLMNCFPRYLDGKTTCLQIAERFNLPFRAVRDYAAAWEAKSLLKTSPAPIDNSCPKGIPPW